MNSRLVDEETVRELKRQAIKEQESGGVLAQMLGWRTEHILRTLEIWEEAEK